MKANLLSSPPFHMMSAESKQCIRASERTRQLTRFPLQAQPNLTDDFFPPGTQHTTHNKRTVKTLESSRVLCSSLVRVNVRVCARE